MTADDSFHQIGAFDPVDAKKLLAALEAEGIAFEVDSDHSELLRPGRWFQQTLGMSPEGSKLLIFVPESAVSRAQSILLRLFPV